MVIARGGLKVAASKRALTLLEVLLGNFLFLLVILGMFGLLAGTLRLGENSDQWLRAENLAQQCLEQARNKAPEDLPTGKAPPQVVDIFRLEYEISPVDGFDPDKLKQVTVDVTWQSGARSLKLQRGLRICGLEDR